MPLFLLQAEALCNDYNRELDEVEKFLNTEERVASLNQSLDDMMKNIDQGDVDSLDQESIETLVSLYCRFTL